MEVDGNRHNSFLHEADRILLQAEHEKIALKLIGAIAVRIHSQTAQRMAETRPITDLDFVGYKKDGGRIESLFSRRGYNADQDFNRLHGNERLMFFTSDGKMKIDIWLEVFRMAHTFNFKDRLMMAGRTLAVADLLMTKLQIVELNEKDVKDVICLLKDHDLSENDNDLEKINVTRLVEECRRNWGTYKTFTMNLTKIKTMMPEYLREGDDAAQALAEKIDQIVILIENAPKSMAWTLRAKVGEKKRWYETPDLP